MKQKAKTCFSKTLLTTFVFLMMVMAAVVTTPQKLQAAPTLSKADFTKANGKPKLNFVKFCKDNGYTGDFSYAWYTVCPTKKGENVGVQFKKFSTKRKIRTEKSSKKDVLKAYGETAILKENLKEDALYKANKDSGAFGALARKHIKKCKTYVQYSYFDRAERAEYTIRFYFNKNDKVQVISYFRNLEQMEFSYNEAHGPM